MVVTTRGGDVMSVPRVKKSYHALLQAFAWKFAGFSVMASAVTRLEASAMEIAE